MECGCGRSPTGECIGWHNLSEEEYQEKLKEYEKNNSEKEQYLIKSYQFFALIYILIGESYETRWVR